eukprot:6691327-Pyramimonas_sp.AAC.1
MHERVEASRGLSGGSHGFHAVVPAMFFIGGMAPFDNDCGFPAQTRVALACSVWSVSPRWTICRELYTSPCNCL